ncbi:MAG: metalloregulator ArsR/SmtB family transcription factor [Bryobacteraceae bacterium]|nr:metalloregulator ArsR/SmtB family transcription factor [Bryobacteraceae bacterium]
MPSRVLVSKEMADLMGVLAHPHRIRIVQELSDRELDVNSLQAVLEVSHSRVSQHLSVLRSHRVVVERREGRYVFYRLVQPRIAQWLREGFEFLAAEIQMDGQIREAVAKSKPLWSPGEKQEKKPEKPEGGAGPRATVQQQER